MFWGPDWMRRRSEATSVVRPVWSYATSSGPKHWLHTYCAPRSYSDPHSRHFRWVIAMMFWVFLCLAGHFAWQGGNPPHVSQELAPFRNDFYGGCRGFIGPVPPPLWT